MGKFGVIPSELWQKSITIKITGEKISDFCSGEKLIFQLRKFEYDDLWLLLLLDKSRNPWYTYIFIIYQYDPLDIFLFGLILFCLLCCYHKTLNQFYGKYFINYIVVDEKRPKWKLIALYIRSFKGQMWSTSFFSHYIKTYCSIRAYQHHMQMQYSGIAIVLCDGPSFLINETKSSLQKDSKFKYNQTGIQSSCFVSLMTILWKS